MSGPKTAIVGAGLMGFWHARYAAREGAAIVGIVDVDPQAARKLAARFAGARAFATIEDSVAAGGVEAVHICAGASHHVTLALTALRSGLHALVEKPVARTEGEAQVLLKAAADAHRLLLPVHQFPFQAGALRLARTKGDLGDLIRVEFATSTVGGEGRSPSERRALLLEILPHPLSLFRRLEADGVDPGSWNVLRSSDDEISLQAMAKGTEYSISISLTSRPTRNELTVIGTKATARLDLYHGYGYVERAGTGRAAKLLRPFRLGFAQLTAASSNIVSRAVRRETAFPGLRELIGRFHRAIRGEVTKLPEVEEILEAAQLVEQLAAG